MKREILRSAAFVRAARRLIKRQPRVSASLRGALVLLQEDAFDSRLRTHKLSGELEGLWACSAGYDLRIIFEFVDSDGHEVVLLHALGSHDEVY